MPTPIYVQVGPTAQNAGDNTQAAARGGHTGELVIQQLHGRYFETMARGAMYGAANQAAQAVSAGLATTYTGLMLYNPLGSAAMLVLNKHKLALTVAPAAAASVGLIAGVQTTAPTGLTVAPVRSNQIGNSKTGVGVAYSAATIATPFWLTDEVDAFTAAAFPSPSPIVDLEGSVGILPGGFVAIGALTTVTGLGFMFWEEVPLNLAG